MTGTHKEFLLEESRRYASIAEKKADYVVAESYRQLAKKYSRFAEMVD